ncbi:MAG: hypothetical protein WD065_08495 [Planctomycetaceae bacterium]
MKRTYWYLAITGISGALITVAIADNTSIFSPSGRSKTQKSSAFFARSSGDDGVSGSAADTGDEREPLRIDPTSSDAIGDDEFDGLLRNADSSPLRSVPADQTEPALYERPLRHEDDYSTPGADDEESDEILPTGGLFGFSRRSPSSAKRPASSTTSASTAKSDAAAPDDADSTLDPDDPSRRISERVANDSPADELDSLSPFDPIDEQFGDEAPVAPEDRDPNFQREEETDLIEIDLGNKQRPSGRASAGTSGDDELQELFGSRGGDASSSRGTDSVDAQPQPATTRQPGRDLKQIAEPQTATPVDVLNEPAETRSLHSATSVPTASAAVTPSVSLTWVKHGVVNIGQPSACELIVQNTGNTSVENVTVDVYVPLTIRLTKAEPAPKEEIDHLTWVIPALDTQKQHKILIELIPNERGALPLTAQVRFTGVANASLTVEEPMLKLALKGPAEVLLGDPASHVVVVSNPGTGVAQNIVLECTLSEGLNHKKGREFRLEVGSLEGGETRQFRLPVEATLGGKQTLSIVALANGGLTDASEATIDVSAPSLEAIVKGPSFRYLQRTAQYAVTVSNSGQAESNNVRVTYAIPQGFRVIAIGQGGQFNPQENTVLWFVGQLGSEQSRELTLDLKAVEVGEFTHGVTVVSDGGTTLTASTQTEVDGAVDLVLEVSEDEDPVEIGTDAVYEIKVHNDGTKAASNLVLSCTIPVGVDFQSASGPCEHASNLGDVSFESIPTLKPGEGVIYRVVVKGKTAGQHRLRAQLTSESLTEPIVDEELTRFYGE